MPQAINVFRTLGKKGNACRMRVRASSGERSSSKRAPLGQPAAYKSLIDMW